jgi:DNA-binding CsgD family transcriptional regulator/PAS domain-containing protein
MSHRLLKAIDAIYQSAAEPSHWPVALQLIADCLDDVGAILLYGKDDGGFGAIQSASLDVIADEYMREWSFRDIRAIRARERGYFFNRDVVTDRDVVSDEDIATDPFYSVLLRKHGLKYFAAATVSPDAKIEVAMSVQRATGKPAYTDAELDLVAQLGRHVERSLRLGIRLMDSELSKLGLGAALSRLGTGVFVLDSVGRVIFSNPKAESLLGDGLEIVEEKLAAGSSALNSPASAAMKRLAADYAEDLLAGEKPIIVHRRTSGRPLALYVLPVSMAANSINQFLTQARLLILVVDPDNNSPPDPSLIRDVLGLTLGEARVTALVGTGQSPRDAADELGITEESARTILKRVFSKVGVSRQGELAALLARLVIR